MKTTLIAGMIAGAIVTFDLFDLMVYRATTKPKPILPPDRQPYFVATLQERTWGAVN